MRNHTRYLLAVAVTATTAGLSGCASIVEKQTQAVMIDTPACQQASCRLSNSKGNYRVESTPGPVEVKRAYGDLTIVCEKNGQTATSTHSSTYNEGLIGNLIFGLGWIPAALIDSGDGAGFTYPVFMVNGLKCNQAPAK